MDIASLQKWLAYVSVSSSAVRKQGAAGVVDAARDALQHVKLKRFSTKYPRTFARQLDTETDQLMLCLPKRAQSWGVARKVLNIFLRNALYNRYLNEHFALDASESFYEVPLDSLSAKGIKKRSPARSLPLWLGVKKLTPPVGYVYQKRAMEIAHSQDTLRVHLDTIFFIDRTCSPRHPDCLGLTIAVSPPWSATRRQSMAPSSFKAC